MFDLQKRINFDFSYWNYYEKLSFIVFIYYFVDNFIQWVDQNKLFYYQFDEGNILIWYNLKKVVFYVIFDS